ncbi:MAG: hypothetical protein KDD83_29480, partial [Caldilineaceae bacterium]|nr:hypothetical protein [Caldilineaceae bacterium]
WLNGTPESDVAVEIVAGHLNGDGELVDIHVAPMAEDGRDGDALRYKGQLQPYESGQLGVGIRVRPSNPNLIHPYETGLNKWA